MGFACLAWLHNHVHPHQTRDLVRHFKSLTKWTVGFLTQRSQTIIRALEHLLTLVGHLPLKDRLVDLSLMDVRRRNLEQVVVEHDHVRRLSDLD